MNQEHGRIFGIFGGKFQGKTYREKREDFQKAMEEFRESLKTIVKPVGEWNTTEIICQDGAITSKVNGKDVDTGKGDLTEGVIGFQSEGAEIHFKNIRIKETK